MSAVPSVAASAAGTPLALLSRLLRLGALAAFALVLAYFAVFAPGFLGSYNLANIVEQSAVLGILAFGMTVVVIGGGVAHAGAVLFDPIADGYAKFAALDYANSPRVVPALLAGDAGLIGAGAVVLRSDLYAGEQPAP